MSTSRKRKVGVLRRRLEYLQKQMESQDMRQSRMAYFRAEIGALKWAIPVLEGVISGD